jgi:hypothetical protein
MFAPLRRSPLFPTAGSHLLVLVLVLVGIVGCDTACGPGESPVVPPTEIAVVDVVQRDQPIVLSIVGQTRGSSDIPIRARVQGVRHTLQGAGGRLDSRRE